MEGVNKRKINWANIFMSTLIFAIVGVLVVVLVYYLFFSVGDDTLDDDGIVTYNIEVNDDRLNSLLKHISLIDPIVTNNGLALGSDLSDDTKLAIVIEDLMDTGNVTINEEKGTVNVSLNDILNRALLLFDIKTYDYYPDVIDYRNYQFVKENDHYIGTKSIDDDEYGRYVYYAPTFTMNGNELYLDAEFGYYETKNAAYTDSRKMQSLCEGEKCGDDLIQNHPDILQTRAVHGTYKIKNNQFILVSATIAD